MKNGDYRERELAVTYSVPKRFRWTITGFRGYNVLKSDCNIKIKSFKSLLYLEGAKSLQARDVFELVSERNKSLKKIFGGLHSLNVIFLLHQKLKPKFTKRLSQGSDLNLLFCIGHLTLNPG